MYGPIVLGPLTMGDGRGEEGQGGGRNDEEEEEEERRMRRESKMERRNEQNHISRDLKWDTYSSFAKLWALGRVWSSGWCSQTPLHSSSSELFTPHHHTPYFCMRPSSPSPSIHSLPPLSLSLSLSSPLPSPFTPAQHSLSAVRTSSSMYIPSQSHTHLMYKHEHVHEKQLS